MMHPHMVLFIPELLENIFSFLDRADNGINACVCKQWSPIALDIIWRVVCGLPRLLALLRPYQSPYGPEYIAFDRQPDSRDWARFQKYASRVRTLRYKEESTDYSYVLDVMARTRTALEILPNLRTLEWIFTGFKSMEQATLFMHKRVRNLIISAPLLSHEDKSSFFVDICARMPNLHSLDLRSSYPARFIEVDILELLRGLPDLNVVTLPEFYLTSTIVSELSRKKHVKTIQGLAQDQPEGVPVGADVDLFAPVLEQGAFPALQDLEITARLGDFVQFMKADFAPINIGYLYINNYNELEPRELRTLLVTLSEHCRLLYELHIELLHVPQELKLVSANQITFETLRPVLSFLNLTVFEIMHKYPVIIALEEIEELVSRWPSLRYLYLNEEPLVMDSFTLDLRALIPFTRHCPKLRGLGLFMDATAAEIHPTEELKLFTDLEVLHVGTSKAHNPGAVAASLSCLCPPGCKINRDITWHELDDDVKSEIQSRSTIWKSVGDLLPTFILRWEEEKKLRENLETRNRLLMDKVNIEASDLRSIEYRSFPTHLG